MTYKTLSQREASERWAASLESVPHQAREQYRRELESTFGVAISNMLFRNGVVRLSDVQRMADADLLILRGLGSTILAVMRAKCAPTKNDNGWRDYAQMVGG